MFETSDPRNALYAIISIAEDARPGYTVPEDLENLLVQSPLSLSPNAAEHVSRGDYRHQ
ncbi:hypothetical protein BJX99DRAFT_177144 [Aspergillus californicus]